MRLQSRRLTWSAQDGSWGIEGVDLSALPPKVYGALCKLKDLETAVDAGLTPPHCSCDKVYRLAKTLKDDPECGIDFCRRAGNTCPLPAGIDQMDEVCLPCIIRLVCEEDIEQ